jgi:ankyrin repeat protein
MIAARQHVGMACVLLAMCPTLWASNALAAGSLPDVVESNDRAAALRMIAEGGDVNERSVDGTTALHWAVHQGDFDLVEQLLAHGADARVRNDYGVTPISEAGVEGDYQIVKALLDAGADVESPNPEGQTVLMAVARTGHVDTAKLLLEHGANANANEEWGGQSALMWAASQKQPAMIDVLVAHGADVDARGRQQDWQRKVTAEPRIKMMQNGGFTPLLYAAREGCSECAARLVAGGADINLSDPDGMTPLVLALFNRNFDIAGVLIEHGADVNQWDWWGRGPLYMAIELNQIPASRRGDLPASDTLTGLDVARMLLERGARVDMRLRNQPPLRNDPGDRGFVDGTPDSEVINTGATALFPAVKASDDAAVKLLLEYHANPSVANAFGITPMLAAAGVAHVYGLFKNTPTIGRFKTGEQAVTTMKLLAAAGAKLDDRTLTLAPEFQSKSLAGLTAAHGAAQQGWSEVIQYLDDMGADINAKSTDPSAVTPRDLAMAKDRQETVALIDKLIAN